VVLAAAALTRGDSDDGGGAVPNLLESTDPGPIHVHGLGINLADGALFIATHMGTYRVAPGEQEAARAGNSHQDTMGYSVVGPNRFWDPATPIPWRCGSRVCRRTSG